MAALNELERKYLVRLKAGSTFSDSDRYIKAAMTTLKKLHANGYVERSDIYGTCYLPHDTPDEATYWVITDAGLEAIQ